MVWIAKIISTKKLKWRHFVYEVFNIKHLAPKAIREFGMCCGFINMELKIRIGRVNFIASRLSAGSIDTAR
jgi:hypothetical protein